MRLLARYINTPAYTVIPLAVGVYVGLDEYGRPHVSVERLPPVEVKECRCTWVYEDPNVVVGLVTKGRERGVEYIYCEYSQSRCEKLLWAAGEAWAKGGNVYAVLEAMKEAFR